MPLVNICRTLLYYIENMHLITNLYYPENITELLYDISVLIN